MQPYTKTHARNVLGLRLGAISDNEYGKLSIIVRVNVINLLSHLNHESAIKTVLSYRANALWREIDLSALEKEFEHITFDYAPTDANATPPEARYDLVLVPLYGFNDENYRLGRGAGWYDRLLARQPSAQKIGVGLEANRIPFAIEQHDIPMDYIVTEATLS